MSEQNNQPTCLFIFTEVAFLAPECPGPYFVLLSMPPFVNKLHQRRSLARVTRLADQGMHQ